MATIDQRLDRLEKQARFFKATTGVLAVLLAAPLLLGAANSVPDVVQARAFEVVDASGRPVVQLESNDQGGRVWVWNKRGKVTVSLSSTEDRNGVFRLYAHEGNRGMPFVVISADEKGGRITIDGADGTQRSIDASN